MYILTLIPLSVVRFYCLESFQSYALVSERKACNATARSTFPEIPSPARLSSHLAALCDDYRLIRHIVAAGPGILHFLHHVHAIDHFTEYHVLSVEERSRNACDKELATIRIRARVLYEQISLTIFQPNLAYELTAIESKPAVSCPRLKFSS